VLKFYTKRQRLLHTLLNDSHYNWTIFVTSNEKSCYWLCRNMVFKEVVLSYFRMQP
jgi:hypothetical protein